MIQREIVGTDVDYHWDLDDEGDISLVTADDNLAQGLYLRVSAYLDSLGWAYLDYGSVVKDYFSKVNNVYNRTQLVNEIQKTVVKDPRVKTAEVSLDEWGFNYVGVHVIANIYNDRLFDEYFIFSNRVHDYHHSHNPIYKDTHICTKDRHYARQGDIITVSCYVLDQKNKKVPIGAVRLSIGGYYVQISDNPVEVGQSDAENPGSASFTFRIPLFIALGSHKLKFKYLGHRGYNSSEYSADLIIVDKIPTRTEFVLGEDDFYTINPVDNIEPEVSVIDYNDQPVDFGTVEYYIDNITGSGGSYKIEAPQIYFKRSLLNKNVVMYPNSDVEGFIIYNIFEVSRVFKANDIIKLVSQDNTIIDYLRVVLCEDVYYLITTYGITDTEYNDDGSVKKVTYGFTRTANCDIILKVVK